MAKTDKKDATQYKSTQSYLRIGEVKGDTMIMESGAYIAVVAVSSVNFALKSVDEQNALVQGYMSFLNSLDFEVQILMQSRKMDIHVYLDQVRKMMERQTNELLRVQTQEYIEFVSKLVENASIMRKDFYILVSHFPGMINVKGAGQGLLSKLFGGKKSGVVDQAAAKNAKFETEKQQIDRKINAVISGLSGLGLRCQQMKTDELTELLYNSYNFGVAPMIDMQRLGEIELSKEQK